MSAFTRSISSLEHNSLKGSVIKGKHLSYERYSLTMYVCILLMNCLEISIYAHRVRYKPDQFFRLNATQLNLPKMMQLIPPDSVTLYEDLPKRLN